LGEVSNTSFTMRDVCSHLGWIITKCVEVEVLHKEFLRMIGGMFDRTHVRKHLSNVDEVRSPVCKAQSEDRKCG
jgi:GTP1/Obg family GTP-binding protein